MKTKNLPQNITAISGDVDIHIEAAEEGQPPKQPTFRMTAYTGGSLRVAGFYRPVVIDLAGLRSASRVSILKGHDYNQVVGQASKVEISAKGVTAEGAITGPRDEEPAKGIIAHASGGFVWPVSVGVGISRIESVKEQETVSVNGQEFTGPMYVVRAGVLREISFVGVGADEDAESTIAAEAANAKSTEGEKTMTFAQWLKAEGHNHEALSDEELDNLAAKYHEAQAGEKPKPKPKVEGQADDELQASREKAAVEAERIAAIEQATEGRSDIRAKAIREGWTAEKAELEVLRASRAQAPAAHMPSATPTAKAVEAGLVMQSMVMGDDRLQASFDEQSLELADRHFARLGVKGLIAAACQMDGRPVPHISASPQDWAEAAFSTNSMSSLVSTSANKIMLESFRAVPSAAMKLFKPVTANDFKTHTGYRLTGSAGFAKVGQDGELKHGTLSDDSKTFSVDTYGEMLGITRQMIINDDLGMLLALMAKIGIDAARKLESVAWTLVKANTDSFFATGNSNYISGADTVLSIAGLDSAVKTLGEQTDDQGEPIMVTGKYLVVPPALSGEAQRIYKASNLVATGAGTTKKLDADKNNYEGQFEPVVVPHLSESVDSTNGSDEAWYLWGDPSYLSPFAVAFLNGVNRPTIEEVAVSGEYLGKAWRGYLDFGVAQWDEQAAVKSKGEA